MCRGQHPRALSISNKETQRAVHITINNVTEILLINEETLLKFVLKNFCLFFAVNIPPQEETTTNNN